LPPSSSSSSSSSAAVAAEAAAALSGGPHEPRFRVRQLRIAVLVSSIPSILTNKTYNKTTLFVLLRNQFHRYITPRYLAFLRGSWLVLASSHALNEQNNLLTETEVFYLRCTGEMTPTFSFSWHRLIAAQYQIGRRIDEQPTSSALCSELFVVWFRMSVLKLAVMPIPNRSPYLLAAFCGLTVAAAAATTI